MSEIESKIFCPYCGKETYFNVGTSIGICDSCKCSFKILWLGRVKKEGLVDTKR